MEVVSAQGRPRRLVQIRRECGDDSGAERADAASLRISGLPTQTRKIKQLEGGERIDRLE